MSSGSEAGSALPWGRRPSNKSQSDGHPGACAGQSEHEGVGGEWCLRASGAKDKESLIRNSGRRAGLIQVGKLRPWFERTHNYEARIN